MKPRVALVTLLLVGGAALALYALRPPPVLPPTVLHPTARQAAVARKHIEGLREQLVAAPAARPGPRTLHISEEDLNVYLASSKAARDLLAPRGVRAVQVSLHEPSALTIRATVVVRGQPQNIQIDGVLAPDPDLGVRFTATSAQVGRYPLPAGFVTKQANALAARFAHLLSGRLPLSIQSVRVEGRTLLITGVPTASRAATRQ